MIFRVSRLPSRLCNTFRFSLSISIQSQVLESETNLRDKTGGMFWNVANFKKVTFLLFSSVLFEQVLLLLSPFTSLIFLLLIIHMTHQKIFSSLIWYQFQWFFFQMCVIMNGNRQHTGMREMFYFGDFPHNSRWSSNALGTSASPQKWRLTRPPSLLRLRFYHK